MVGGGNSRESFYRFQELYEKGSEIALAEITERKPIPRNRVEPQIEHAIVADWPSQVGTPRPVRILEPCLEEG